MQTNSTYKRVLGSAPFGLGKCNFRAPEVLREISYVCSVAVPCSDEMLLE